MAVAVATPTKGLNEVLPTLALDTNETTYTLRNTSALARKVQFICETAWSYASASGGAAILVGAGQTLDYTLKNEIVVGNVNADQILYVKTQSGTGTLRAWVVD